MSSSPSAPSRLSLRDSLSGSLVALPKGPGDSVSIYACGVTPYSEAHVGHARSYVAFALLETTLSEMGMRPTLARNITDIDDKILAAAKASGSDWREVSERHAADNRSLMAATGLSVPLEPKASEHIPQILDLIGSLMRLGLAYSPPSGGALYRVAAYRPSGPSLSRHKEGSLLSEAGLGRVSLEGKEDPRDFALWKRVPGHEPGWDSPWGRGRPGWHVECSAMIGALFGGSVDIHGGGSDLKFPHHHAEILQSEPVWGKPLASVWAHNGSVLSEGHKMSKSLGNYVSWRRALEMAESIFPKAPGDLLRWSLLSAHWAKPLDWSAALLERGARELESLALLAESPASKSDISSAKSELLGALAGNLNFPAASALARSGKSPARARAIAEILRMDPSLWRRAALDPSRLEALESERAAARDARDWASADRLRAEILALGGKVSDAPVGKAAPRRQ